MKFSDIFHISAQNIDCVYSLEPPRRGGSNEYQQSMFLSRNKKNNVYPCMPNFAIGGSKLYRYVFVMVLTSHDHFPSLHSDAVDQPVLSVLWFVFQSLTKLGQSPTLWKHI